MASKTNISNLNEWLEENTDLSTTRTSGDSPAVKLDREFINRSERYEVRDLIIELYDDCNLAYSDENFKKTLKKIMDFNKGKKTKRVDYLSHLKKGKNCKDK